MEGSGRVVATTLIAPVAWGASYWATREYIPAGIPLWAAAFRAVPAAVVLLLIVRRPPGPHWHRALVLGALNAGAFFALVYLAAALLPSSVAATVMGASPLATMAAAAVIAHERIRPVAVLGGVAGVVGVALVVGGARGGLEPWGVAASIAAMVAASIAFALAKRWGSAGGVLPQVAWQLAWGGLLSVVAALLVEGPPPTLPTSAVVAFAAVSLVGTAAAYVAWFHGLSRLPAATVGLLGLANPLVGAALGIALAGETVTPAQLLGGALIIGGITAGLPLHRGRDAALARTGERTRRLAPP